jgi:hypothetical protein
MLQVSRNPRLRVLVGWATDGAHELPDARGNATPRFHQQEMNYPMTKNEQTRLRNLTAKKVAGKQMKPLDIYYFNKLTSKKTENGMPAAPSPLPRGRQST